jgi:hypothetical protein
MSGGKLAEKLALAGALFGAGCGGDHHVSPWGDRAGPSLEPFVRAPDLDAQLALVDAETASLKLVMTNAMNVELPPHGSGRNAVLRGYRGQDATGRPIHAVRVATPRGVVLALGPLDAGDLDRGLATELVPTLTSADPNSPAAWSSGTDLNGDGAPDVVVKNEAGALAIWRVGELGSGAYGVTMAAAPTSGIVVDGDPRVALWGQARVPAGDAIAPSLTDVATFAGGAYSDATPAARAWHTRALAAIPTAVAGDAPRLRATLERAWHGLLEGKPRDPILGELSKERVPRALAASFEAHQRRLASLVVRAPEP